MLIFCYLSLFISQVYASQINALKLYQQGEHALNNDQLEHASNLFKHAIKEYSIDGELVTKRTVTSKIVSRGRSPKRVENVKIEKAGYYPNRQLEKTQLLIQEKFRATNPPVLKLRLLTLQEPTDDNILDGGESGTLSLEISNLGKSPAQNILLNLTLDDVKGVRFENEFFVDTLLTDESEIKQIKFHVEKSVPDMLQKLVVQAKEQYGYQSNELEISLPSKPHLPDEIILTKTNIEDLNGDGLIEPNEMITVKTTIANIGKGVSNKLEARLKIGENIYLSPDSVDMVELGEMFPGSVRSVQFSFLTNQNFTQNQHLPVSIQVVDHLGKEKILSDLGLTINISNKKVIVNVLPRLQKEKLSKSDLVDVDMFIPEGLERKKNAIAVVIGNKNYRKIGLPRVEYAHNDARVMKEYLIKALGFDENNIFYLEDATSANFTELFGSSQNHKGRVFNHVKTAQSELFIYYSGHGAPDIKSRNSFFVPVDADPNYIALSGYSLDLFYKNIAKIPAKETIIVLDTCFSGNSDGGYLLGNISPALININKKQRKLENTVIFSSSRDDQVSGWFHKKKHGLFTYYFLKGLSGSADANNDQLITSSELGSFVIDAVPYQARRMNGFEQNPTLLQNQNIDLIKMKKPDIHTSNVSIDEIYNPN